jgi:hypothetical protein
MERLLVPYLAITGIGALAVLAMPWLVVLGLFALFLPGLILGLLPSAFLYGLVFAAGWYAIRAAVGDGALAITAGLAAAAAFALLTPQPTRVRDLAAYRATILPDVEPEAPTALQGHVRFDLGSPRLVATQGSGPRIAAREAGFACDGYCLAALFTPGVTGVTINRWSEGGGLAPDARRYRLAPRPGCESNAVIDWPSIQPPLPNTEGPSGGIRSYEDGKLLVSQWAMRMANEFCLVTEPAGGSADYTIVERSWRNGAKRRDWSFGPGLIATSTVEIFAGSSLVHRAHLSTLSTLAKVLLITPEGGLENFRFQLARESLNSRRRYADVPLSRSLARHTNLAGRPQPGAGRNKAALLPDLRRQLTEALADPAATPASASFQVLQTYLETVGGAADDADLALIARLFADPRLTRFPGAWALKLPLAQARPVYDAYTARLLATGAPMEMRSSFAQTFVANLGGDSVRLIGPQQERLIGDPAARLAVPELVRALGHGEPGNGRRLFAMLQHHAEVVAEIHRQRDARVIGGYGRQSDREAHIDAIGAVQAGLCLLAPQDPALLAELEAFLTIGTMPPHLVSGHNLTAWHVILARMGKPIEALAKPTNMGGSEASYRRNLREKVERWRPDRC